MKKPPDSYAMQEVNAAIWQFSKGLFDAEQCGAVMKYLRGDEWGRWMDACNSFITEIKPLLDAIRDRAYDPKECTPTMFLPAGDYEIVELPVGDGAMRVRT